MEASATHGPLHRHFRRLSHALSRFASINPRRCFCMRCVAAHSGVYRRTRVMVGQRAYVDMQVLGIRVRHRYAFDLPLTSPPSVVCVDGNVVGAGHGRRLPGLEALEERDHAFPGRAAACSGRRQAALM